MHLFADVGLRLVSTLLLFLIVFGLEQLNPIERHIDAPGLFRNYVVGYFAMFFEELAVIGTGFVIVHGFVTLPADGGSVWKAILFALPWMAARDFFYYWMHRLQHWSKWLWAEHALHHSEEHLNITTALRHHWLEMPLSAIFISIPLNLLFKPPAMTYPIVASVIGSIGLLNHMNARVGLGRFGWLVSTPQNHRIHHSNQPEHTDKNFAAYFPIWDVLFGTYYQPKKAEYPPTGLSSGERVTSTWQALVLPFQLWKRMFSKIANR